MLNSKRHAMLSELWTQQHGNTATKTLYQRTECHPPHNTCTCCKLLNDIKEDFKKYFSRPSWELWEVSRKESGKLLPCPPKHYSFQLTQTCSCRPEERSYCFQSWQGRYHKVVLDANHYHDMALKQLSEEWTCKILDTDPYADIIESYQHYLQWCRVDKVIDKFLFSCLRVPNKNHH